MVREANNRIKQMKNSDIKQMMETHSIPSLKEEEAIRMFRYVVAGIVILAASLVAFGILAARWLGV